jgi:hypothetical protein
MARGAVVMILTRSPLAYASSLCFLLGLDYNGLFAANKGLLPFKLRTIIDRMGIEPDELLYVGDQDADRRAALEVGCGYLYPTWIDGDPGEVPNTRGMVRPTGILVPHAHPTASPGSLLGALQKSARTGRSLGDGSADAFLEADLDPSFHSSLAWALLRSAPAQDRRRQLQDLALAHVPRSAYACTISLRQDHDLIGVSRTIMRRAEYERDEDARASMLRFLRDLNPLRKVRSPPDLVAVAPDVPALAVRGFRNQWGGELWRTAKNWRNDGGKGSSGPEVRLALIELPALVMASHVAGSSVALVPAPSTDFSPAHPGQLSTRLGYRIGELSDLPILPVLRKTTSGAVECTRSGHSRKVVLVDDQLTDGGTAGRSVVALRAAGFDVGLVLTWSASNRHLGPALAPPEQVCWLNDAMWLLGRSGNCGPSHGVGHSPAAISVARYLDAQAGG